MRMPGAVRAVVAAALALGVAACTVGPDYVGPDVAMPDAWRAAGKVGSAPATPDELATWWHALGDPVLDDLVKRALRENLDLKTAGARIRAARAQRAIRAAAFLPQLSANAEYQHARPFSENSQFGSLLGGFPGDLPPDFPTENLYQGEFDASWEIDLFGGIRRSVEAADASLAAAEDDAWAARVSIVAEVARTYVALRALERRVAIANENVASQRDSVRLTEDRFRTGIASELDVRQARSLLATTEADVPALESAREQTAHAIAVLLALPPDALHDELAPGAPIPGAANPDALAVRIPIGLPAELLRRRPDVRRAERELAAATARVGVATAELYPKLSLTGFIGLQSISTGDLFTGGSRYFSAGPTVTWRVFEGGRLRAAIDVRDAETEQSLYAYEQTVLVALQDVADALVAYGKERRRHDSLVGAVAENERAVLLSRDLYAHGLGTYLAVLDAQRAQYEAQDALVQSDQALVTELIATFKAIGGGWPTS